METDAIISSSGSSRTSVSFAPPDQGVQGRVPAFICEVKEASFFLDQLINAGGLAVEEIWR